MKLPQIKWYHIVIALSFILLFAYCISTCNQNKKVIPVDTVSKTDTIVKDHYIHDTISGSDKYITLKPKTIVQYKTDTLLWVDTLITREKGKIDTLIRYIPKEVDRAKITQIYTGKLTKDSLRIDIIDTGLQTYTYPLNLDSYNYQFFNGNLKATPIDKKFKLPKITTSSNFYLLYDPFHKGNYSAALDYSAGVGRLSAFGMTKYSILENPKGSLYVGLRYRLK